MFLTPSICESKTLMPSTFDCWALFVRFGTSPSISSIVMAQIKYGIVVAIDSYKRSDVTDKLFLDLADNAAREFSCWFGTGTLPEICRLYPNIFSSNNQQEKYSLKFPNCHPSGRILIDLESRKYLVEFKNEPTIENDLDEEETSTITLVSRLINGCLSRNIDTIQMIDLNFLTKNNAFEENSKFELLTSIFDECEEYNRSMLVFDIDSLVMVSVTDSAMSESNSISNMQLYQFIREKCKRAVVEHNVTNGNNEKSITSWKEKWIVMVVKRQYLRDLLVKEIDFKKTLQQSQQEREDEEKHLENETVKLCPKCLKCYIPSQVNHGSCQYHDAYVVDLDDPSKKLTQDQANEKWQKAELEASMRANENSNEKPKMPTLYWACCSNYFKSGQTCKIGTCGLPDELKENTIDSKTDPVMLVQEHFQKNTKAEQNIAKLVKHYQTVRNQTRSSVRNLTTNNQTRQ
ncbi:unnamed protein product [Rotaria sp. Silwood1]|nr:unnamed protein product [Rotaria sp. Silwood1]